MDFPIWSFMTFPNKWYCHLQLDWLPMKSWRHDSILFQHVGNMLWVITSLDWIYTPPKPWLSDVKLVTWDSLSCLIQLYCYWTKLFGSIFEMLKNQWECTHIFNLIKNINSFSNVSQCSRIRWKNLLPCTNRVTVLDKNGIQVPILSWWKCSSHKSIIERFVYN